MIVGIPVELDPSENRVALTPAATKSLVDRGHTVLVESRAGLTARFADEEYRSVGARVVYDREEVFGRAGLLLKVAGLDSEEAGLVGEGQVVMAFHHLAAANLGLLDRLLARRATLIGYEITEDARGDLPILHAMSEIAGQLAVHVAARYLETRAGGRGILLGGGIGIPPAHVVILGAGVVGIWAARTALGNGAQVTVLDTSLEALQRAEETLRRRVVTEVAHPRAVARAVAYADVLIGAILIPGERTPIVVTRPMVATMKPGSVVLDISIDQGGCVETSRPTHLSDPIFIEGEVIHYAVPNMASAVARTASLALSNTSLPFVQTIADLGIEAALKESPGLRAGVYAYRGELASGSVARSLGIGSRPSGLPPAAPRPVGGVPVREEAWSI
ncbi:MAG TPA: alanine dehydrogenase [Candidatus Polarisedimenticolia bacterium]|nr:alanine dehydrogenase [Candidatus Polarisedimenticolia bacterium]